MLHHQLCTIFVPQDLRQEESYRLRLCVGFREADVCVDVVGDEEPRRPPYDTAKARGVMTECDRHVNFARSVEVAEEDWEDRITRLVSLFVDSISLCHIYSCIWLLSQGGPLSGVS